MTRESQRLIDGYLDQTLSPDECAELNRWLKEATANAHQFAQASLLHDRLRGELLALDIDRRNGLHALKDSVDDRIDHFQSLPRSAYERRATDDPPPSQRRHRFQASVTLTSVVLTASVLMVVLWKGFGETPAAAAAVELNRLIMANTQSADRTYHITVEEVALPQPRGERPEFPDRGRPPKPPMDGAVLHVRGGRQFVLLRKTVDSQPFVTGSNGQTSWAVRPDGPVRTSSDLTRFNRDLPGHEHSMPLNNIHDGLERLRDSYDVQLLPVESAEDEPNADAEPSRLLVATKKSGFRGPKRVEITYSVRNGLIQQMRFVEMPYGPERLTLRMTLLEERNLGAQFFNHESHHDPDRSVELESNQP